MSARDELFHAILAPSNLGYAAPRCERATALIDAYRAETLREAEMAISGFGCDDPDPEYREGYRDGRDDALGELRRQARPDRSCTEGAAS